MGAEELKGRRRTREVVRSGKSLVIDGMMRC